MFCLCAPEVVFAHLHGYIVLIFSTIPQSSENASAVCSSLMQVFAVMGVPTSVKTDNGAASKKIKNICKESNIKQIIVISYNPQCQGIIEGAIKQQLFKKIKKKNTKRYCYTLLIYP